MIESILKVFRKFYEENSEKVNTQVTMHSILLYTTNNKLFTMSFKTKKNLHSSLEIHFQRHLTKSIYLQLQPIRRIYPF